jgi:hypothetical protein
MSDKANEAQRRWRENNPEKAREAQRRWRENNPDYMKEWRAKNPEKAKTATQRWRENNPEKYLESARAAYRRRDPAVVAAKQRDTKLRRAYGIGAAEFDAMLTAQGNCCAICKTNEPTHKWVVDHHHATGKIRGILCNDCNIALRKDRDTIEHLRRALEYIETFEHALYGAA